MPSRKDASGPEDAGQSEIQDTFDREQEQGFRGVRADPTPLENYTLEGVKKAATPESAAPDEEGSARRDPEAVYGGADGTTVIATDSPKAKE